MKKPEVLNLAELAEAQLRLMNHTLTMVYRSLDRDLDHERERDPYAEEMAIENRNSHKEVA